MLSQRLFPKNFLGCMALVMLAEIVACSHSTSMQTGNSSSTASPPDSAATTSAAAHITSDAQQRIGVTTAIVTRKTIARDLRTVGRVAFDPDLAIAKQAFLALRHTSPSLREASRSRLKILGMSDEEIRALERTKKMSPNLYLPDTNGAVWVYATVYPAEMEAIHAGLSAEISLPSGDLRTFAGIVRGIDSVINPITRSARARIEVANAGGILRPDTFVNVMMHVNASDALTIPKSAILFTGTRALAFVQSAPEEFTQRAITTGIENGDDVVVQSGLNAGDIVVSHAAFFVDSESQLKPAASPANTLPTCPPGESWDVGMSMCMTQPGK